MLLLAFDQSLADNLVFLFVFLIFFALSEKI
jgi:hypothetical protein